MRRSSATNPTAAPARHAPARVLATAALVVLALVGGARGAAQGHRPGAHAAVVGGTIANPATVPYVAKLNLCTGSLIAPDRVLTAGHCTDDLDVGQRVTFAGGEVRHIARIADDYDYARYLQDTGSTSRPQSFDVAILGLDAPVTDLAPIRLATTVDAASAPGTMATTLGYGVKDAHQHGAGVLRRGRVEIHGDRDCRSLLAQLGNTDEYVAATMLCTTDPDHAAPFVSGCYGDSGGPLVVTASDGTALQVGIDNWGVFCGAHHGDPEIYTDAAVIQAFATTPAPVWEPLALTRPRLRGTVAAGRAVFCTPPSYADPQPTRLVYRFFVDGLSVTTASTRRRFVIPSALRHERLTCAVVAEDQGGKITSDDSISALVANHLG